jgi:hypothetical protein
MKHIVALLVLTILGQSSAGWAQTASPESESGGERAAYSVGSVLGTLLYTPLKAGLCVLGGGASTFAYISSGPRAMRAMARTACRGTWVITPDHLKGTTPIDVLDDSLTPRAY